MNMTRLTLKLLAMSVFALACVTLAQAQATRTWVSGVGDDVNPCSRTAPCKTFAGAISKTAAAGEIDALDPGGFGAVTITKSISIDGQGTLASILSAGTNGVNVNVANTDKVVLRNLSINGAGTGVNGINWFNAGGFLIVENVEIERVTGSGIFMNLTNSGNLMVSNTRISNCGSTDNVDAGIRITTTSGTAKASISHTSLINCRVGVNAVERAQVFVRDSEAIGNQAVGLPVGFNIGGGTSSTMFLENCTAAHNNSGLRGLGTAGAEKIFLSNCDIYDNNNAGVNMAAFTQAVSFQNNRITANALDIAGSFVNAAPGQR
jgi:hypothetical protein